MKRGKKPLDANWREVSTDRTSLYVLATEDGEVTGEVIKVEGRHAQLLTPDGETLLVPMRDLETLEDYIVKHKDE